MADGRRAAPGPSAGLWRDGDGRIRWGWRLLLFLVVFVVLLLTFNQAAVWLRAPWTTGAWAALWTVIPALLASLVATWLLMERVDGLPVAASGLPLDGGTVPGFLRGTALGGGLMAGAVATGVALGWIGWTAEPGLGDWPMAFLRLTAFFAVAALVEEVIFRGYPFQVMAEGMGGPAAVGITSVLFGLLHGWNPGVTRLALVNITLAGLLLGLAYWRTYSLWFAGGVHFGWNWAMGFLADLPVSGLGLDTPGYEAVIRGPSLWTGGSFGPEAGLLVTVFTGLGVAWLLFGGWPRRNLGILALGPLPDRRIEGDVRTGGVETGDGG